MSSQGYAQSVIGPDDLLEITINSGREGERARPTLARVSESGTVEVPMVGPIPVGGLEPFDASQAVSAATIKHGIFRQPHCSVEIKSKAVNHVTVMGAVKSPGVHELPRNSSDLVSAIAQAGGLTKDAGNDVEILRQSSNGSPTRLTESAKNPESGSADSGGAVELAAYSRLSDANAGQVNQASFNGSANAQLQRINLAALNPRTQRGNYYLGDRDVVMVLPRKKSSVHVGGLVKKPGQFELSEDEDTRLLDAIAQAGGSSSFVADKVYVIRHHSANEAPIVIQASLQKAKQDGRENLRLAAGDMISIEQTPFTAAIDTFTRLIRLTVSSRASIF